MVQKWVLAAALAVATCGSAGTAAEPASPAAVRTDDHGDPLPASAVRRFGTLRWRHGGPVFFLAYRPDGKTLVSASADGTIRLLDSATGAEPKGFRPFVQPDASLHASASVTVVANEKQVSTGLDGLGTFFNVALSADGRILASSGNDPVIRLWKVDSGEELAPIQIGKAAAATREKLELKGLGLSSALALSPDGRTLIAQDPDQLLHMWDVATGKELRQFGKQDGGSQISVFGAPRCVAFAPDGRTVAAGEFVQQDGMQIVRVRLWDAATGKEVQRWDGEGFDWAMVTLAFSPDGKVLAWAEQERVHLCETATGKELRQIEKRPAHGLTRSLAFSPDGKTLCLGSFGADVSLWETASGKELRQFAAGPERIDAVAFAPDGRTLITGGSNQTIRRWATATGQELAAAGSHQGAIHALVVSPDGQLLTTFAGDDTVRRWQVATGKELAMFRVPNRWRWDSSAALSADGRMLAALDREGTTVRLWDIPAGKELRPLQAQFQQGTYALAFSPDGMHLASRAYDPEDATVRLWAAATGKQIHEIEMPNPAADPPEGGASQGLAFSADGAMLAVPDAAHKAIWLVDVATGKLIRALSVRDHPGIVRFAFAPNGYSLASVNRDSTVSLWETSTGQERCRLGKPHVPPDYRTDYELLAYFGLAYSPDGKVLVAGRLDRSIGVWQVVTGRELGRLAGHQGVPVLAFAGDGRTLFSGSTDTAALAWDLGRRAAAQTANVALSARELEACWAELLGADAARSYRAMGRMVHAAEQSQPLLRRQVKPVPPADPQRMAALVEQLNSSDFAARQLAAEQLEKLGEQAVGPLRRALAAKPALEPSRRIEALLAKIHAPITDEVLRALRSLEVLELIGGPEAQEALRELAKGAEGARLTRAANAALERLEKSAKPSKE